jgi:hypothetical protein
MIQITKIYCLYTVEPICVDDVCMPFVIKYAIYQTEK